VLIGVVDYEAGNLKSVQAALDYLKTNFVVSKNPNVLMECDRLIFPGVGQAYTAMQILNRSGLGKAIIDFFQSGKPILGICLGAQIIMEKSEEENSSCLGILPGWAVRFPKKEGYKVPHMGWNQVKHQSHRIFKGIASGSSFYFVHSYYPQPKQKDIIIARTDYIHDFPSALCFKNMLAFQFHPEKSGKTGLRLLDNFLSWNCA
jgi:glutamine amidotransferase